jgi:hypothetical protein
MLLLLLLLLLLVSLHPADGWTGSVRFKLSQQPQASRDLCPQHGRE